MKLVCSRHFWLQSERVRQGDKLLLRLLCFAVAVQPYRMQRSVGRGHITSIIFECAGKLKGDAKITYEDNYAAGSAVDVFDNKEFQGAVAPANRL